MQPAKRYSSKKRSAIYRVLADAKDHPSADMLFRRVKAEYPDISNSTVYRCLSGFCEDGSAVIVGEVKGCIRYDACTAPHPHFICRSCGQVADMPFPPGFLDDSHPSLSRLMEADSGCDIQSWSLSLYGICPVCKAENI